MVGPIPSDQKERTEEIARILSGTTITALTLENAKELLQISSKNTNYLIVTTSSEGTARNGVGDTIKMELMDILEGRYNNPHVSIWYYRLDDVREVPYPETWLKANPNLGVTVSYETYQADVERAETQPATKAEDIFLILKI